MKSFFYIILFLCFSFSSIAQQKFTISGYVKDKKTGEVVIGATVYEKKTYKGTMTNSYGYFSFLLPAGEHTIICSSMGYGNAELKINLDKNVYNDFLLISSSVELETVTVKAESSRQSLKTNTFSSEKLSIKTITEVPAMLGEADVIKAIQLQSGVKTLGDGSSGMFVRGGSSDQNLILIDEAPIYNPSHLFGLMSVFNSDALNHVDLYKSNMPAQYGGRVSSVIDCKMKEGNLYDYDFSAGLSPFAATVTANGPIAKGKSSFLISGRKSFIDLFFGTDRNISLVPAFYDINLKVNTEVGKKNRLFLSFYNGKDILESADGFYNKWGNTSGTLRWNYNNGSKLFVNTSLIMSDYQNNLEFTDEGRGYKWLTGLNDINLKCDLSYYIASGNSLKMGAGSIYHKFIPGETSDTLNSIPRIQAFEHAFYILNDLKLNKWFACNYGVRLSAFQNVGEALWYNYDENYLPVEINTNKEGAYQTYIYVEPRISTNISLHSNYSFKAAYARNVQYMQVLQNNSLSYSSLETWFPANPNVKPIVVDVVSAGWFQNLSKTYFLSVELYYKAYQNQIDYVDHARLVNNPYIEAEIREGTARAFGAEVNLKKDKGRLKGNISYTYGRALRKIKDINKEEEYSSPFDIPHDFRITSNYKINDKWTFNSAWMYMSGRPKTFPVGFYQYQSKTVPIYSDRNSSRFPDYHRLDISFNYKKPKQTSKINWEMNVGVFNLYAKKNPLGYEFDLDNETGNIKAYQYTLFTILPNFSIKAKW